MSTSFNVTGPALIGAGTGVAGAQQYLGTTRGGVRVREVARFKPVFTDFGGDQTPSDMAAMGKMVFISMELNHYDPAVLAKVQARMIGATAGTITANEIGTLLLTESTSFVLMVKAPYQTAKSAYSAYPPGIRVLNAYLADDFEYNMSTENQVHRLLFVGLPNFTPSALSATLWDNTLTGFPSLD